MFRAPQMNITVIRNNGTKFYTFPNASFSLLDSGTVEEMSIDRMATLSAIHGAENVEPYELEIMNDIHIYEAPLSDVLDLFKFKRHMKQYQAEEVKERPSRFKLTEVRKACPHFFSVGAMNFFNSQLESEIDENNVFITSEQFSDDVLRRYTLRKFDPKLKLIDTVGEFQKYESLEEAQEARAALL